MTLIANTTDQKFLEAILIELKKTNELLESLCSVAKDTEQDEVKISSTTKKGVKDNGTLSKSSRGNNNSRAKGNSAKSSNKRKAVHDS